MQVKDICRVGNTDAYCRIDDIKGDTAKVYFGRDAGGAYWDRLPLSVLQETDRTSYGLPSWMKAGQCVYHENDDVEATILSIGRTYATLLIDGNEVERKKIDVVMNFTPFGQDDAVEIIEEEKPVKVDTPKLPSQDDFSQAMAGLFGGVGDIVTKQVMAKVEPVLKEIREKAPVVHIHELKTPDGKVIRKEGEIYHPLFDKIRTLVQTGKPIYIYGPAGTGKTHFARQLAESLGCDFYFTDKVSDESELVGYPNINGEHVGTPFTEWYLHGGLFLFDEMDRSEEQCLVRVNSALANGYCTFPVLGNVKMHPNCRIIAAGNTSGRGATEAYNTAHQLDESTLNRFMFSMYFGYCDELDLMSAGNNKELAAFAKDFRSAVEKANVVCTCSYRNLEGIATLMALDYSIEESLDMALFKGMDTDAKRAICKHLKLTTNQYSSYCRTI